METTIQTSLSTAGDLFPAKLVDFMEANEPMIHKLERMIQDVQDSNIKLTKFFGEDESTIISEVLSLIAKFSGQLRLAHVENLKRLR